MISPKVTILLIDTSRFYLTIEGQFLKASGAHIVEAQSIGVAQDIILNSKPDLICLDAQMEGGKGIVFCQQIKEIPTYRRVPVILLYDQEDAQMKQRCLDAGCDGYLTKPLNRQRFLELGRSLLAGIRERRIPCELKVDYRMGEAFFAAKALDISSGGMFLQVSEPLAVGNSLKLEIRLGGENEKGPRIFCDGTIAWENGSDDPVKPHLPQGYGVKFTVVPPQAAAILNGFLKTLSVP